MSAPAGQGLDALRQAWRAAHLVPLWESPTAHQRDEAGPRAHRWAWQEVRPLIGAAIEIRSPQAVERRVLSLVNPRSTGPADEATVTNIAAALQILMPGEAARAHRHSMNALRFVLEGSNAYTIVDGKRCLMREGDLVITPGWTWHEHVHEGQGPIVWLDVLDVPLHQYLATTRFEPGPSKDIPRQIDDAAFGSPNLVPDIGSYAAAHSPVFRYPWEASLAGLKAAPKARDGSRRLRYVNPLTGGAAMALLDCYLVEIDARSRTLPFRTTSNAVCAVVEGSGSSEIGGETIAWGPKDIFTLPHGNWTSHAAADETARLFIVTDREVFRRLGLLEEELRP
jgi:gentisate 1,2-dioxygenase